MVYALIRVTGLKELFEKLFAGRIRNWRRSSIVLLHLLSKFTPVDRIYKINKNTRKFFYYFFDRAKKINPLKDEVYELQKKISDNLGQKIKESLLRYYHDNNFLDLSLVFIDGHVIAYFGKEAFQKLKHGTRNKVLKALEVFNFSDKNGRIFYFRADHDVEGMQKNIENLLDEVGKIIGLDKIRIFVFDRGGFSGKLFKKLMEEYKIKFITLAVQNDGKDSVKEQINKIRKKKFKKLKGFDNKKYIVSSLNIDGENYRALLILNTETKKIHPFITNMDEEELPSKELLQNYSTHWRQEQQHNAFIKLGGDMHSKALQDIEFDDKTKIKQRIKLKNKINKKINETVRLELEERWLEGKKLHLTSKIKPKSKQTDNRLIRRDLKDIDKRLKEVLGKTKELSLEIKKTKKRLNKIPKNPKKKKYKYGPVDYSLSIVNLASNLNSKIVEIFSNGKKKYQLATLKSILYCMSAEVWEDDEFINIECINIRQDKDIERVKRLCDYFNQKKVRLHGKIMRFSVRDDEKTPKIRAPKNGLL